MNLPMHKFLKNQTLVLLMSMLAGCNETHTYSYLMQHPAVLKDEFTQCQASIQKTKEQAAQCEIVLNAAANMMTMMNEQQQDPEKFGQRVMDAEAEYVKSKADLSVAQQEVDNLRNGKAPAAEIAAAQAKLDKLKLQNDELQQEIKTMLAVLGMNSPE